jgi:hypothetical protein
MTDQNPGQTQRMPVPEPNQLAGASGSEPTASEAASEPEPGSSDTEPTMPPVAPPAPAASPWGAVPPPIPPLAPPPTRDHRDRGRSVSILFGLVILGVGLWFFAEHTLGYQLPRIRWSQLWPVFIIGIGLWVVLGSMRRGSR